MPLLDLSQVTQTLMDTIRLSVTNSPAWNPVNVLSVVPSPPDSLSGDNTLSFYLYHVTEDIQNRNAYVPGVSDVPVRYLPLELRLHYLLTAHSSLGSGTETIREQLMMGLAMKALHDYPKITDETVVSGTQVMPLALRGDENCFRVTLMPKPASDAVDYWTAGSAPLRLSAYYEIAVIQLEPEAPQVRPGRVLNYNVFVMPTDNPRADTSANLITFTIPTETDPRTLELRPAQVTYDQSFTVEGTSFIGETIDLLLRRSSWDEAIAVDGTWAITPSNTRIGAIARQQAAGIDIVPGIYTASIRTTRTLTTPTGGRVVTATSNETPFSIAPLISAVTNPDAQGNFQVTGAIFEHPDIEAGMVQVYIGSVRLQAGSLGSLQQGEFHIVDDTTINVRLPGGISSGENASLRVVVNGVENAPRWVTAP